MYRAIKRVAIVCCLVWAVPTLLGQGSLEYSNRGSLTRVGTVDGPLAGTNIWGILLGGPSPDSLVPLGVPVPHFQGQLEPIIPVVEGWPVPTQSGFATVPGVPDGGLAYVQLLAWDGGWGISLDQVPPGSIARTEISTVTLMGENVGTPNPPRFEQAAIVQPIPEPSAGLLLALGLLLVYRARRVSPTPGGPGIGVGRPRRGDRA